MSACRYGSGGDTSQREQAFQRSMSAEQQPAEGGFNPHQGGYDPTDLPSSARSASSSASEFVRECFDIEKRHVDTITPEEFEKKYIVRALPLVLQGCLDAWPAYNTWTIDFFKKHFGDAKVDVDMGGHGGPRKAMTIKEYVNNFAEYERAAAQEGAPVPYLRVWNFLDDYSDLRHDFDAEPYFKDHFRKLPPGVRPPFTWLFMGPAGIISKLHVDIWYTDAWLCNLQGRKKFTVYHPSHRKYLEVNDEWVDLARPDLDKFPDFHKATPVEFVLEQNEMLYIPRRWPHAAVALEPSLSLSANFLAQCNKRHVMPTLVKYLERRQTCEGILKRPLRGSDNLMKFCCHGGRIPVEMAKAIMGAAFQKVEDAEAEEERARKEERRKLQVTAAAEGASDGDSAEGASDGDSAKGAIDGDAADDGDVAADADAAADA